jgi:chromosome segregation ATPase
MDQLDDVARAALASLRSLESEIAEAQSALDALDATLEEVGQDSEAAWKRVVAAADTARAEIEPHQGLLSETAEQARTALAGAGSTLDGATRELEGALSETEQGLRTIGGGLQTAESDTLPEIAQTGDKLHRLVAEIATAEAQLSDLVSEATALLSEELPSELRASAQEIHARSEALERYAVDEGLPSIEAESNGLTSRLEAFHSDFSQCLARMVETTEQCVRDAVASCLTEHNQLLADLDQGVRQAIQELEELGRRLENGSQRVQDARRTLGTQGDLAEADLNRAIAALREVQSFFTRQGFVGG